MNNINPGHILEGIELTVKGLSEVYQGMFQLAMKDRDDLRVKIKELEAQVKEHSQNSQHYAGLYGEAFAQAKQYEEILELLLEDIEDE